MSQGNNRLRTTTEHAKLTLAEMARRKIPLAPENYYVWYEYLGGSHKGLKADMDNLIATGEVFTDDLNAELYAKYFGKDAEADSIEEAQHQTQRILKTILGEILNTQGLTSKFGDRLEAYSEKLNKATKLSEMQEIIQTVIQDTGRMAESSRRLERQLQSATSKTEKLRQELQRTQREALTDRLTGLPNRRAFDRRIEEFYNDFRKSNITFCALMMDIDHFKAFNDKFSHKVGDAVLQALATVLRECLRPKDFPARYGGEEFVVLVPMSKLDNACEIAEAIRKRLSEKRFKLAKTGQSIGRITISIGVAEMRSSDTTQSIIERADKALYLAKDSGRNGVKTQLDLENAEISAPGGAPSRAAAANSGAA